MAQTLAEKRTKMADWEEQHPKVTIRMTVEEAASLKRISDAARLKPCICAARLIRFALQELVSKQSRGRFKRSVGDE